LALGTEKSKQYSSLLWPAGGQARSDRQLSNEAIRDLALETLVEGMCPYSPHRDSIRTVLYQLCQDSAVLVYRQAILNDLLHQPILAEALKSMLPLLDELMLFTHPHFADETSLHEVIQRAGELQLLADCVHHLSEAFKAVDGDIDSPGLRTLQSYIDQFITDKDFQQVIKALPEILSDLRACTSITVGVNLDEHLRPEEAMLLSVNSERFTESSLLDRLLGKNAADGKGIASLHSLPMLTESSNMITGGLPISGPTRRAEPMMVPLFRDLSRVLEKTTKPIAGELRRYVHLNSQFLKGLRPEIIFYVRAVELARKVESLGLPLCLPEIAPSAERICEIEDNYNIQLALHLSSQKPGKNLAGQVVTNEVVLGSRGRIVILTGPNQGGKTTYMQAVGQAQVMAQAGLFVPGRRARISPVEGIYTHYPVEERLELGTGRFGDEARRIRAIFEQVTRDSLVLLNESLSTTNMGESLYLAQDIVRVLRQIGLRAIFTTHQHELAATVQDLNMNTTGDSQVVSMVASYEEGQEKQTDVAAGDGPYSYRIVFSPPLGRSYAARIAARYGISLEQLVVLLRQRQVLDEKTEL
jgi:DNA mismatch repair protein MutS